MDRQDARDVLFTLNPPVAATGREPVIADADTGVFRERVHVLETPDRPELIVLFTLNYHSPAALFSCANLPARAHELWRYIFFTGLYRPVQV